MGGLTPECRRRAVAFYEQVCDELVEVSSTEAAELTKLPENIFRSVNIALVNELAMLCDRMSIDIWEVVEAAATNLTAHPALDVEQIVATAPVVVDFRGVARDRGEEPRQAVGLRFRPARHIRRKEYRATTANTV